MWTDEQRKRYHFLSEREQASELTADESAELAALVQDRCDHEVSYAGLGSADLRGADLRGARLLDAKLDSLEGWWAAGQHTRLEGADLRGADVIHASLIGARCDARTHWPDGYDPRKHSAFVIRPEPDLHGWNLDGQNLMFQEGVTEHAPDEARHFSFTDLQADQAVVTMSRAAPIEAQIPGEKGHRAQFVKQGNDLVVLHSRASHSLANLAKPDAPAAQELPLALDDVLVQQDHAPVGSGALALLAGLVYDPRTEWPQGFHPQKYGARPLTPKADLHGLDLTGARFVWAALQQADHRNADMAGADLRGTNLRGADLRRADLHGATLTFFLFEQTANLMGADLRGADLSHADLTGAYYDRKTIWPSGFDPRQHGARQIGRKADLHGWRQYYADLSMEDMSVADLRRACLVSANLRCAKLGRANLRGALLSGASLQSADFNGADLRDADLSGGNLSGADLRDADLRGADLRDFRTRTAGSPGTNLSRAGLTGARYDAHTRWPHGFAPKEHGAVLAR